MQAEPTTGYREGDFERAREAAVLARALELAANAAGAPVGAEEAWRAASGGASDVEAWPRAAASAARALGLQPSLTSGAPTTGPRSGAAVVRIDAGRWLVALGGRRRKSTVVVLDERGESRKRLTPAELAKLSAGKPWLHLQPGLALDTISAQRKPQLAGRPWLRLRSFLRLERRDLWVVLVYAIVIGGVTLATPIAVQALVNTVAFGSVLQPLVVLTLLLFGGLAFAGLLSILEAYVVEVIQRRVFIRVADDFGRRLPTVRADALDSAYGPELVNRFFDVLTIQKSMSVLLLDGLSLTLQTVIGMFLLGFYHPLLLAFDAALVALLIFVLLMGRGAVATGFRESSAKYKAVAWLEDVSRASHLFRGETAAARAAERTDILCRDYLHARKSHFRVLLRQISGGIGLQVAAMVALLGVGGWLVINRQLTLGQLVAAELVITAIGAGFLKLGKNLEKLYDLNVGVLKIGRVADLPTERRGGEPLAPGPAASVALREATVRRGDRTLLAGATVEVEAGQRLRLTGEAGSGKSTLLEVLGGLREADEGTAHIDGLDLRRSDLRSVRDQVRLVRAPAFVDGSVLQNLELTSPTALSEGKVREWLRLVDLESAVDRLPQGLDTPLQPEGGPLSEAQARRLALVRALVGSPRVLLVDRALDSLGLGTAQMDALLDVVMAPDAPWTLALVTDDQRVSQRCDRHVRLSEGTLEVVQ